MQFRFGSTVRSLSLCLLAMCVVSVSWPRQTSIAQNVQGGRRSNEGVKAQPPASSAPKKEAEPEPKSNDADLGAVWTSISSTTSEAVLETFIVRAAGTIYADLARARLEELKAEKAAQDAQKQQETPPADGGTASDSSVTPQSTCEQLWHQRNAIFHSAAYCFGTGKGVAVFGNAGCFRSENEAWRAMGEANRQQINRIRELERANGC